MKKVFEKTIGDEKVGFRFNMLTLGKACELEKCSMDELYKRLGMTVKKGKGGKIEQEQPTDINALCTFFYAAAICYKEGNNEAINFTKHDVADWLDYLGNDIGDIMSMAFNVPSLKNQTAPQTEGL